MPTKIRMTMTIFAIVTSVLVLQEDHPPPCPVVVAYDEAHKFARCKMIRQQMITIAAERRHLGVSLLISSQDPTSIPEEVLPLLDGIGVFQHDSPGWNRCLAQANQAFGGLTTRMTSSLQTGQMWFWSKNWIMMNWENHGVDFHGHLILMEVRPRAAQHGGATKQYGPDYAAP